MTPYFLLITDRGYLRVYAKDGMTVRETYQLFLDSYVGDDPPEAVFLDEIALAS